MADHQQEKGGRAPAHFTEILDEKQPTMGGASVSRFFGPKAVASSSPLLRTPKFGVLAKTQLPHVRPSDALYDTRPSVL
jgi:hypothetical protein